jgi:hypothetical protein
VQRSATLAPAQPVPLPDPMEATKALQDARGRLSEAIEERDRRKELTGAARIAYEASQRVVNKIRGELDALADVDEAIARHHADAIKAGRDEALPEVLQQQRDTRDRLQRELSDAVRTAAILESDLHVAQARLDKAQHAVVERIADVIDHQTEIAAAEMRRLQGCAFAIKRSLMALRDFRVGGAPYRLTPGVWAAVDRPTEPWAQIPQCDRNKPRERWQQIVAALMENANAPLDG